MRKVEIHSREFVIDGQEFFSAAEETALEDWLQAMKAQDAADKRCRSVETVRSHRKRIQRKSGQNTGEGVLVWCMTKGYVRMLILVGAFNTSFLASPNSATAVVRAQRSSLRAPRDYGLGSLSSVGGMQ